MQRLRSVIEPWIGSRYMEGQAVKGEFCDCVGFVASVGADLEQIPFVRRGFPQDVAFHDRESAMNGMRDIMRAFSSWERIEKPTHLQPGDVLATGPANGGPGHAIFVAPWADRLVHATQGAGVHLAGMLLPIGHALFAVYRHRSPEAWAEAT